jgi:cysteine desulfurase
LIKGTEGGLLVSAYEHHSVLNAAASEALNGREVVYVIPKKHGFFTPETLSKKWFDGIRIVSVMTANNEIGTVNPIELLAEYVHKKGALLHADAVQAVGHIPINVRELGVDFLSASAHKFNGPKGIGFLYIRKGLELKRFIHGGQQEGGFRAGTENVAAIVGMAEALKFNCENMERNTEHLNNLAEKLCDGIGCFAKDAIFNGFSFCDHLPGFVSVSFPYHSAEGIMHILDLKGIAVSTGAACDSKSTQVSHVLKAIHLPMKYAKGTIRITLGIENTENDVFAILRALKLALR